MSVITDYIEKQVADKKAILEKIYEIAYAEVSPLEDGWKYGISTFIYKGQPLFGFAATQKGISVYPYGNSTIDELLHDEIAPYVTGGGTLSFPSGTPIPDILIARISQVRKTYIEEKLKK